MPAFNRRLSVGLEFVCELMCCTSCSSGWCCIAGALKLVGECFPWAEGSQFVYSQDNHNSVLGIRELALNQGATATCVEMHCASGVPFFVCFITHPYDLSRTHVLSAHMLCGTHKLALMLCAAVCNPFLGKMIKV